MLQKYLAILTLTLIAASCRTNEKTATSHERLDSIAREYVRLGLSIGRYDTDFVDAYYGPDSLRPAETDTAQFPKEAFLQKSGALKKALAAWATANGQDTLARRAAWLSAQLTAFERRIHIFPGPFVAARPPVTGTRAHSRALPEARRPFFDPTGKDRYRFPGCHRGST